MRTDHTTETRQRSDGSVPDGGNAIDRRVTLSENVTLTIKVLAITGLLGAVLWGIDLWTSGG